VTGYMQRWFIRTQMVIHPSTNPAVHDRESKALSTIRRQSPFAATVVADFAEFGDCR